MMAVCRTKWAIFDSNKKQKHNKNKKVQGRRRRKLLAKVSGSAPALPTVDEWPIKIFYSFACRDRQRTQLHLAQRPLSRNATVGGHAFFLSVLTH